MWTLRVLKYGEEYPLVYIGTDTSIQTLFEVFRTRFPDALYSLESMLSGTVYLPGTGYPFWFTADGLSNMKQYVEWKEGLDKFAEKRASDRRDYGQQVTETVTVENKEIPF